MKRSLVLACLFMLLNACSNNRKTADGTAGTTDSTAIQDTTPITKLINFPQDSWYKHYTGNVGGKLVEVDFCAYDEVVPPGAKGVFHRPGGICVYTASHDMERYKTILTEASITTGSINMEEVRGDETATWHLENWGDSLVGERISENGKRSVILLKEDYSHGSYPLTVAEHAGQCSIGWGGKDSTHYKVSIMMLTSGARMSDRDAAVFDNGIAYLLTGDKSRAMAVEQVMIKLAKNYIAHFRKYIAEKQRTEQFSPDYDREVKLLTECAYNNDGLLEFVYLVRTANSIDEDYSTTTLCLDMKERKGVFLESVFVPGADITSLLEKEVAKALRLQGSKVNILTVDKLLPTHNFIVNKQRIAFYYSPGEIADKMYGDFMLEIPLDKIKDKLTPHFKERMGLK